MTNENRKTNKIEKEIKKEPALQEAGGSFCRSFNSLLIRFEAIWEFLNKLQRHPKE